jgi:hypothetical protein
MNDEQEQLMRRQLVELTRIKDEVDRIREVVSPDYPNIEDAIKSGKQDITKYFDRIHDNLFTFNNMLIAGYFALIQLKVDTSKFVILIPIINLVIFIIIDYLMMQFSRANANIGETPIDKIPDIGKKSERATQLSLVTIVTTLIVTIVFICYL